MTELETRLREWGHEEIAAAPDVAWPQWDEPAPRRGRLLVALASAAVVIVAVAVAVVVVRDRHRAPAAGTDPSMLYDVYWTEPISHRYLVFHAGSVDDSECPEPARYTHFDGDELTLGGELPNQPAGSCAPVDRTREQEELVARLSNLLSGPMTWNVDGSTLTLTSPDGASVILDKITLPGSTWVLREFGPFYAGPTSVTRTARVEFGSDGTFRADDLCGGLTGTFVVVDEARVVFELRSFGDECTTSEGTSLSETARRVFDGRADVSFYGGQLALVSDRPRFELVYDPA